MFEKQQEKTIEKMCDIQSRAAFLYHQNILTVEEFNKIINKTATYIPRELHSEYIDAITQARIELAINFGKTISLYKQYDLKAKTPISLNIDNNELEKIFFSFLKYINCQKLFDTIKKDMLSFPKNFKDGQGGYTLQYGKLSYIVVKSVKNKLKLYDNLAHEMGHALPNYVLYNTKYAHRNYNIKQEIFSILFEKLFLLFLHELANIDQTAISNYLKQREDVYFKFTKTAKKSLDIIDNPRIPYTIYNCNLNYTQLNKHYTIPLYNNIYAIGNIVATKLIESNSTDMDYFIKHLKDIIIELESLSPSELIEKQFDLPSIERYLDKQLVKIPSKNC